MPIQKNKPSKIRRVMRFDPPTLDEAIFAAQGLADDVDGQTQIAALLMGLSETELSGKRQHLRPAPPPARPLPGQPRPGRRSSSNDDQLAP